jgi:hypothetical protein
MNNLKIISFEESQLLIQHKLFKRINDVLTSPFKNNRFEINIDKTELFLIENVCKCLEDTNWNYLFEWECKYTLYIWKNKNKSGNVISESSYSFKWIILSSCQKYIFGIDQNTIFKLDLKTNVKQTITGGASDNKTYRGGFGVSFQKGNIKDGGVNEATFDNPISMVMTMDNKQLFVLNSRASVIRSICTLTGNTSSITCNTSMPKYTYLKLSLDGKYLIASGSHDYEDISVCIQTMVVSEYHIHIDNYFNFVNHCNIISPGQGIIIALSNCKNNIDIIDSENYHIIETIYFEENINNFVMSKNFILYVCDESNIYSIDLSHMFKNLKMFIQLQLSNYSYLSQRLINTF